MNELLKMLKLFKENFNDINGSSSPVFIDEKVKQLNRMFEEIQRMVFDIKIIYDKENDRVDQLGRAFQEIQNLKMELYETQETIENLRLEINKGGIK